MPEVILRSAIELIRFGLNQQAGVPSKKRKALRQRLGNLNMVHILLEEWQPVLGGTRMGYSTRITNSSAVH